MRGCSVNDDWVMRVWGRAAPMGERQVVRQGGGKRECGYEGML